MARTLPRIRQGILAGSAEQHPCRFPGRRLPARRARQPGPRLPRRRSRSAIRTRAAVPRLSMMTASAASSAMTSHISPSRSSRVPIAIPPCPSSRALHQGRARQRAAEIRPEPPGPQQVQNVRPRRLPGPGRPGNRRLQVRQRQRPARQRQGLLQHGRVELARPPAPGKKPHVRQDARLRLAEYPESPAQPPRQAGVQPKVNLTFSSPSRRRGLTSTTVSPPSPSSTRKSGTCRRILPPTAATSRNGWA